MQPTAPAMAWVNSNPVDLIPLGSTEEARGVMG